MSQESAFLKTGKLGFIVPLGEILTTIWISFCGSEKFEIVRPNLPLHPLNIYTYCKCYSGNIYISASAPKADSKGNFTTAAIFKAVINANNTATLTSVLNDNSKANDATPGATAATTTLNMSDPDSNNIVPA